MGSRLDGTPVRDRHGSATLYNFLFLDDVGDNVDYAPIFASGHGFSAAVIALSGPFLGNGLLYFVLYGAATRMNIQSSRLGMSFVYWLSLMCAANVWGYVPLRAITTHADIALASQGFQLSPWMLFPFVFVPSMLIVWHFFFRMVPVCFATVAGWSANNFLVLVTLTAYWFFSFFGGDGITGKYGLLSQLLCIASKYPLLPLCVRFLTSSYFTYARRGCDPRQLNSRTSFW
jgi:hypothetical protein